MANFFKDTWWALLLIVAGGIVFFLSFQSQKPQSDQGVVLSDIFHQKARPVLQPVPPTAMAASPVVGHETGFIIQVYSFQDKARAETSLQALKNSGYQAFLAMSDLGQKGIWYRVRVGGIGDDVAARKMLAEIRKNYNSGFILKPGN